MNAAGKRLARLGAFLLMVLLLLGAVALGAMRYWGERSRTVRESLPSLTDMLKARVETGNNILTVAARHWPASGSDGARDDLPERIREDLAVLSDGKALLSEKAAANARFGENGKKLLAEMAALPSVLEDARDLMYVTGMLPQALEQSALWTEEARYNAEAEAFNRELGASFSGRVARLLGVRPAQLFSAAEGEAGP